MFEDADPAEWQGLAAVKNLERRVALGEGAADLAIVLGCPAAQRRARAFPPLNKAATTAVRP